MLGRSLRNPHAADAVEDHLCRLNRFNEEGSTSTDTIFKQTATSRTVANPNKCLYRPVRHLNTWAGLLAPGHRRRTWTNRPWSCSTLQWTSWRYVAS
jgi:hypothetical protein